MDYSRITELLGKFSDILKDSEGKKEVIGTILNKYLPHPLSKEKYTIKNDVLMVNASPLVKNELFIHSKKILEDLEKEGIRIKSIR
jgi:hypothetical protein